MLRTLGLLYAHLAWADGRLLDALDAPDAAPPEALRELGHVLGADEIWLSRLEGRSARAPVWPELDRAGLRRLTETVHAGYSAYLATLDVASLDRSTTYTTSDGRTFSNASGEILLHVALHAQYHRGKVNLLLRQAGLAPAPIDYIAYVRGAPAAVTPQPRGGTGAA
jgi:uncharacterized damage-inducible protein DinB